MNASQPSFSKSPVLYDQDGLLIVHKAAGVLSHPNLIKNSNAQTQSRCAFEGTYDFNERCFDSPEGPVWLIHRLDQDTSGILVAARSHEMARQCRELFEAGKIRKIYRTLVSGQVRPANGHWADYISTQKSKGKVRSRAFASQTPNAKLSYRCENYFPKYRLSLLKVELVTGKTHQIRVQAEYHGYPVAGDEVYGNFPFNKKLRREVQLKRLFLHASEVELIHPANGQTVKIEDPLPEDLRQVLKQIS